MSRLLLVRHGDTELNSARRFQGHSDVELSATGYGQAERLRDRLVVEGIDVIYSSDLKRALTTAELISSRHGVSPIACHELREINYGKMERLNFDEIKSLYPEVAELFADRSLELQFPNGESVDELKQRLTEFLARLRQHAAEQTILVVSHSGPLRLMVCYLLGLELRHWRQISIDLASLSIVNIYPGVTILSLLNDTSHLR